MDNFKIWFEDTVWNIMDSLEEFTDRFKIAGGTRFREVWLIIVMFFVFSIVARIFKLKAFISWRESLTALILVTGICIFDYFNINGTEKIKEKFLHVKEDDTDGK